MNKQEKMSIALQGIDETLLNEMADAVYRIATEETMNDGYPCETVRTDSCKKTQNDRKKKRLRVKTLAAAAACLLLFLGIGVYDGILMGNHAETGPAQDAQSVQLYVNLLAEVGAGDLDAKQGDCVTIVKGTGKLDAVQKDGLARIDAKGEGGSTREMTAEEITAMKESFADYTGIPWTAFMDKFPENYQLDMLYTLYTRTWGKDGPKGDYDILHDYVLVFRIGPDEAPGDGLEENVVRLSLSAVGEPLRDYFFGDEIELQPSTAGEMTFTVSGWRESMRDGRGDYIVTFAEDGLSYDVEMRGVTEEDVKAFMAAFAGIQNCGEEE